MTNIERSDLVFRKRAARLYVSTRQASMHRIVVLNSKGGSGKTTVATNMAAALASAGHSPALMDFDPQGSSMRWLERRELSRRPIRGIAAYEVSGGVTRAYQLRSPQDCDYVVIDTPAALDRTGLVEATRGADSILIPVMPSAIDIHAAVKCISDLLLVSKLRHADRRVGIIANRVKSNTVVYQSLLKFINSLDIPLVATLRDTQNYTSCFDRGIGVAEMPKWQARKDEESVRRLVNWIRRNDQLESLCAS